KDIEKEAAAMRELGIDIILLSNKTHFRFNFYPYWDKIVETLGKITRAFHKYDIKVVEHHSCSLTHIPLSKEEWEIKKDQIDGLSDDGIYAKEWEYVEDWITSDGEIDGVKVSSFLQIHGGTHDLSPTQYDTHVVCYNNEDYRRIYFKHLEDIYAAGVDGIMTDDVQFFAQGNACACPTCRKLFKEWTGYEMPESKEEWVDRFMNNFDDPRYVAFDQFRRDSAIRFQRDVDAHFRSLGLNLLRPNYISNEITSNYSAYPFSNCADLWDVMFQENVSNSIIKYSWPYYACEAVHRYAFASQNDIPSMSMFYCNTPSDIYFSFALCSSWGQLFNPSLTRTDDMVAAEGLARSFEKKYPELVYDQKKQSDVAVMFSMKTRDLIANAPSVMNGVMAWLQSVYFTQRTPAFVLEEQSLQEWQNHKVIVLPHVIMMSDDEIIRAREYVKSGGTLVWVGSCGIKTPEGFNRSLEDVKKLLGCRTDIRPIEEKTAVVGFNGEKLYEMTYGLAYDHSDALSTIGNDTVIAQERLGFGEILFLGAQTNLLPYHQNVHIDSNPKSPNFYTGLTRQYCGEILEKSLGKILDYVVKTPGIQRIQGDYLTALYKSADQNHTIAHLVAVENTLCKNTDIRVGMKDPISRFDPWAGAIGNKAFCLKFLCEYQPAKVRLLSPEWAVNKKPLEMYVDFTYNDGVVSVQIPDNTFSGYLITDAVRG
ncbi:MAG TPA: hypothetical protein DDZ89_06070, partial [Clostridiales bacterium]|nr:hypothetical protein [Clostridiales bacterium]